MRYNRSEKACRQRFSLHESAPSKCVYPKSVVRQEKEAIVSTYLMYQSTFETIVDEFDFLGRIKPSAILTYFQNAAVAHADLLGIGFEPM